MKKVTVDLEKTRINHLIEMIYKENDIKSEDSESDLEIELGHIMGDINVLSEVWMSYPTRSW
ncbi:MAG: hypothetical protein M1429_00285 [Patescibacteria group bacterium]|nr:hypothetical protein [Patescibacteria group bacterium]